MKVLRLVLVVCLALCVCFGASAESFSVRNGITFGMSSDEIIAIEKANGNDPEVNSYSTYTVVNVEGTIASVPKSMVQYTVTNTAPGSTHTSDALYTFVYELGCNDITETRSDLIASFDTLNSALCDKYGDPDLSTSPGEDRKMVVSGRAWELTMNVYHSYSDNSDFTNAMGLNGHVIHGSVETSEWLIENDDGTYLKIEHLLIYGGTDSEAEDDYLYYHYLGYQLMTEDEVNAMLDTYSQGTIDGDI